MTSKFQNSSGRISQSIPIEMPNLSWFSSLSNGELSMGGRSEERVDSDGGAGAEGSGGVEVD